MTEADIEIILQGAKEKYPEARPRIISDNGPQFIAKDFKEFIRISGMTHVRISPFLPAIEREDRALAQIAQSRVHPAGNAVVARSCATSGAGLRGPLQQCPTEQRHWLPHADGHAGGLAAGDPRGA
jgi:transposase InsO family protein